MEPRGAVGVYQRGGRPLHRLLAVQRAHPIAANWPTGSQSRGEQNPDHRRDTGGSFGMKIPIFNESTARAVRLEAHGRPVKWISTRTEAFLSDAQARDNVTEAELALDKDGHLPRLRVKTIAAIGAYLQHNMPAFLLNAGTLAGIYRTPAILVDITAVFSPTPIRCDPIAAMDDQRPAS